MARRFALVPMIRKLFEAVTGNVWIPTGKPVQAGGISAAGWQGQAWQFWRCLGEIHYPTSHLARQVGRLGWDVTIDGRQLTAERAEELLAEVTAGLGVVEASRRLALNLQVGSEAWYIEDPVGNFQVYSVVTPGISDIVTAARASGRIVLRVYFPDPVDPTQAEASIAAIFGPADELLTLESLSRAQSRSRIAQAGMLLVASSMQFQGDADPFGKDLEDAMEAAIKDPTHPSAMVPIKVEVPEEMVEEGKGVRHVTFERAFDNRVHEKVERATRRIALGLDVPADLLLGTEGANHWTAWLTALETYTSHLEPLATPVGELYAVVAEQLLLREVGVEAVVRVTPNPSKLLAKRSTVRDALDAAKLGAVGLRYVRDAIGATDEDAPTDEELEILRLVPREPGREPAVEENPGPPAEASDAPVAATLIPQRVNPMELAQMIQRIYLGVDKVVTAAEARSILNEAGAELDVSADIHEADVAPVAAALRSAFPALPRGESARGELIGAMTIAAGLARGRVGSRVRNAVGARDRALIDGVDNADVASLLGLEHVRQLIPVDRVVLDALEGFEAWWAQRAPAPGPARTAAVLFATHLIDTLCQPSGECDLAPAGLVDLLMGLATKEAVNA